jgi:transposase
MAKPLLPDALWIRIEPLLPRPKPRRFRFPGRKPIGNREALTGILIVLKTGIHWEDLPCEMGCGSGMTCWRRLAEWTEAGVWSKLQELLLAGLEYAGKIDWSRATIDTSHVRARVGERTGPSPVDRRKTGSKHFVVTDRGGIPLATTPTAADDPDARKLEHAIDSITPVRRKPGRPKQRPRELNPDRAFDLDPHRQQLRRPGIRPRIARRRTPHRSGLGVYRWVGERTLSWLHNFDRLRVQRDKSSAVHQAFLTLEGSLICLKQLC